MYLYSLHGYEENTILQHEIKYTKEEFTSICENICSKEYCLSTDVIRHLIKDYGFQTAKYTAGFFVDGD